MQKLVNVKDKDCIKCGGKRTMQHLNYCNDMQINPMTTDDVGCRHHQSKEHLTVQCTSCHYLIKDVEVL